MVNSQQRESGKYFSQNYFRNGWGTCSSRGRDCHCSTHHQLSERTSRRLHQALHVPRHLHHDQGAHQAAPRCLHLHEPSQHGDLDVRGVRLHWCQHRPLPGQQVSDQTGLREEDFLLGFFKI